jgi:hypothetical protein
MGNDNKPRFLINVHDLSFTRCTHTKDGQYTMHTKLWCNNLECWSSWIKIWHYKMHTKTHTNLKNQDNNEHYVHKKHNKIDEFHYPKIGTTNAHYTHNIVHTNNVRGLHELHLQFCSVCTTMMMKHNICWLKLQFLEPNL